MASFGADHVLVSGYRTAALLPFALMPPNSRDADCAISITSFCHLAEEIALPPLLFLCYCWGAAGEPLHAKAAPLKSLLAT